MWRRSVIRIALEGNGVAAQTGVVSRRRKFSISIAVILAIGIAAFLFRKEPEPIYKGVSLSRWYGQWFQASLKTVDYPGSPIKAKEAADAIQQIGTNALPFLLDEIRHDGTWAESKWISPLYKVPWLKKRLANVVRERNGAQYLAANVFELLGTNASPVIPELMKIITSTTNRTTRDRVIFCLIMIGDESVPALRRLLQSPDPDLAQLTAASLDLFKESSSHFVALIPDLERASTSTNQALARFSANALEQIRPSQRSFPLLTNALNSQSAHYRAIAINALAQFGKRPEYREMASNALPTMVALLSDLDEEVRKEATNALVELVPVLNKK